MSSDFFYEPPEWFELFRPGRRNTTPPWKATSLNNLEFELNTSSSSNIFQPLGGFRIIIHNTDEFPFRTGQHLQHSAKDFFHIFITPTMQLTDKVLKSWSPEKRGCLIENERTLKYFKIYTRVNCEHECLSEGILKLCGCVPFYLISKLDCFE